MDVALKLSLQAKGLTSPNPLVGAIVVKNNRIISKGFHKRAGLEHAEVAALRKANRKAIGSELYVTLEPCSTFGRTPPCTDAITKSGIKKVVIGMCDPNPKHRGKGLKILAKKRIKVISGVLEDQIKSANQPFIKYIIKNMPYVTLKLAQSLDGKIATKTGDSQWITNLESRSLSRKIRNNYDAIMVGINTVLKDNPLLSPAKKIKGKRFYKIILDTRLRIMPNFRIFKDVSDFSIIIATSKESLIKRAKKVKALVKKGAIILGVEKDRGALDIKKLLQNLSKLEITNILVEGGGRLAGSLLDKDLIDYALFFISPKVIGGKKSIASIYGKGIRKIKQAKSLKDIKIERIGSDLLIQGALKKY